MSDPIEKARGIVKFSSGFSGLDLERTIDLLAGFEALDAQYKAALAVVDAALGKGVDLSKYRNDLHVYADAARLGMALHIWSDQQPEQGDYHKVLKIASLYMQGIAGALKAYDAPPAPIPGMPGGRLTAALQAIIRDAPETEPKRDAQVDEAWARAHEHWRLAETARAALAGVK